MPHPRAVYAFQLSNTLSLQIYRATEAFPKKADPELLAALRFAVTAINDHIVRGSGMEEPWAIHAFQGAMAEADGVADLVESAERLGYLPPDTVLELLETQTALLMQLILLLGTEPETPVLQEAA